MVLIFHSFKGFSDLRQTLKDFSEDFSEYFRQVFHEVFRKSSKVLCPKWDLKLKCPLEDVYGSTAHEAFEKAKMETQLHYRATLAMQKAKLDAIVL
ncbi:unnamed protein product [Brassica oleracea var. botrytis]|uniref:Uncharacterized protein n=2 Tax=Brassica TaxID=3705 RepID=A0A0D3CNI6_BRAOL|nr:unnamed protein product [Brassica napus]